MGDTPGTPASAAADPDAIGGDESLADDPTGRLGRYLRRTQTPLDLLALGTLWIVIVPVADFNDRFDLRGFALVVRILLSIVYGIDMAIRCTLATHHWRYLRRHPLNVAAIIIPPVRVMFSLRLIRALFRRGNLDRFLLAAVFLLVNGSLIVWMFERNAPGANIHTFGQAIWWGVVTATTVGYGDYYPVTTQGRVAAGAVMFVGITTAAVITAQVASSFVDQSKAKASAGGDEEPPADDARGGSDAVGATTIADLDARLARIEAALARLAPETDAPPPG
jgi:voltage-gated potassium channel